MDDQVCYNDLCKFRDSKHNECTCIYTEYEHCGDRAETLKYYLTGEE